MLTRRLYIQIYLTVLASLVLVVVLSGLIWSMFARDRLNRDMFEIVGTLTEMSLPAADAPLKEQAQAVSRLGSELGIDITLFGPDRSVLAATGRPGRDQTT